MRLNFRFLSSPYMMVLVLFAALSLPMLMSLRPAAAGQLRPAVAGSVIEFPDYRTATVDATVKQAVISLLQKEFNSTDPEDYTGTGMTATEVDLNDDGVKEIIVRLVDAPDFCSDAGQCRNLVFGRTAAGLVSLGSIEAVTLQLAKQKNNGVHDLLADLPGGKKVTYVYGKGGYSPL